ncbi:MAG: hypothetical protein JRJ66_11060 [Deltaproteobacteria bacterium]|nr:hypothetical protein [Deltaproteobacteria bacterium]
MDRLDLIAQIPLFKELPGEYHKDLATIALFDMGYMSIGQVNEVIEAIKQSE